MDAFAAPSSYRRRRTREVRVGSVGVGGANPIRIQSMTTPPTTDTAATVEQTVRLVDAGCEIVRLTVPTSADAANLPEIRRELARRGVHVPLIADIHFTPAAAMRAVEYVEKIRINPGNYADRKRFAVREYTDAAYARELERIEKAVTPLVRRCKELGVAMRIGTNHGSLSDRILNRYGDTAEGMVESALEFVRICESLGYHDLILSMKASNPTVVLRAYRLLVERMDRDGMDYPLHLGVTEAGEGEDGRIKSAVGIGPLLDEGLGDTVRVSLTEDPVAEIPVARALVEPYNRRLAAETPPPEGTRVGTMGEIRRRPARRVAVGAVGIGGSEPVRVEVPLPASFPAARLESVAGTKVPADARAEIVSVRVTDPSDGKRVEDLRSALDRLGTGVALSARLGGSAAESLGAEQAAALGRTADRIHLVVGTGPDALPAAGVARLTARVGARAVLLEGTAGDGDAATAAAAVSESVRAILQAGIRDVAATLDPTVGDSPMIALRHLARRLDSGKLDVPLVLLDRPGARDADPTFGPAWALGGLLCDGLGDAVHVALDSASASLRLAYSILQAARSRITRTEFISCPSCGRTLFDLESTTARIRKRTSHLKGVKIAIMGCIVNGPGEMADADFGYVGWGEGKVALFVGREMVEKDVPTAEADQRLVELIRKHGRWVDPPDPAP